MAQSLRTLESARRRWLAQVSHELRTPLAVLRGEIEAMDEGVRTPTPQVLAGLNEQAAYLTRLVNDLHTLAIADLGGMPCNFDWGDAGPWLQRSAQRCERLARQAGLALQIEVTRAGRHAGPRVHAARNRRWRLGPGGGGADSARGDPARRRAAARRWH